MLVLIYTVVALLSLVGLQWPDGVQSTLTVLSATLYNLGAATFGCWISFSTRFHVVLGFPILLLLGLGIFYAIIRCCLPRTRPITSALMKSSNGDAPVRAHSSDVGLHSFGVHSLTRGSRSHHSTREGANGCCKLPDSMRDRRHASWLLQRSYLSFLLFYYTVACSQALSIFDCVRIDGAPRLRAFVGIECYTAGWYQYLFQAIAALVVYGLGIPSFFLWRLRQARWGADDAAVRRWFGEAVLSLHPNRRWWDVFTSVWRLLTVMVVRLPQDNNVRVALLSVLVVLRGLLVFKLRPAIEAYENSEEYVLLACTLVVTVIAIAFDGQHDPSDSVRRLLYALAMMALITMMLAILRATIRKWIDTGGTKRGKSTTAALNADIDSSVPGSFGESAKRSLLRAADGDVDIYNQDQVGGFDWQVERSASKSQVEHHLLKELENDDDSDDDLAEVELRDWQRMRDSTGSD